MNTIQFFQRLARNLRVDDPASVSGPVALELLAAGNSGLQAYYRELPAIYKRTTVSATLRAPESVTLAIAAQYSTELTAEAFLARQRGCTVLINGQATPNEVVSEAELLDGYLGTDLAPTATVYGDCAQLEDIVERVTSEVRLYDGTGCRFPLVRDETLRERNVRVVSPARPRWYWMDYTGASQGGQPEYLLRVSPLPDVAYTVRFEAELGPRRLTFSDFSTPTKVPVPEQRVEDLLLPLCEAELTRSPYWREGADKQPVLDAAVAVLSRKINQVPADIGAPFHRVGRPRGF